MQAEQRRTVRVAAPRTAYVSFGPEFSRVGTLRDLGTTGAAFEYFEYREQQDYGPVSEVALFVPDKGMYLPGLPCRIVYDIPLQPDEEIMPAMNGAVVPRRCGLEFVDLVEHQKTELENFTSKASES